MNDPVGDFYVDKIIGKCPLCEHNIRAYGGWEEGVGIVCTNYKCQADWRIED